MKYGVHGRLPQCFPDGPLATTNRIAEEIFNKAYYLELESAPSYKVWAYKRAGWTIDELSQDVMTLYGKQGTNGLKSIPKIGSSLADFIAEKLDKL